MTTSEQGLTPSLLRQAMSSSRGERRRAVDELARLAGGVDPALAGAARPVLVRLAADPSRRVADAAAMALEQTSLRLGATRVDFGHVPPGMPRLVADVAVGGPPSALTGTVTTSAPGLRAALLGDVLRISLVAGESRFAGTVRLSGPAGAAELTVTCDVVAGPPSPEAAAARRKAVGELGWLRPAPMPPPAGRPRAAVLVTALAVLALLVGLGVVVSGTAGAESWTRPGPAPTAPPPVAPRLASTGRPAVIGTIAVGREPEGVAVSPDSRTVYVANQGSHILTVLDAATRQATPVQLRNTPRFVALSHDGKRVYVALYEDDKTGSAIAVVDAATRKVLKYVATGEQPYDPAIAPDGRLWVPIHSRRRVEIYTAGDERPAGRVLVPQNPHSVAFSLDGLRAFTPNHESNSVSVIDMRTPRLLRSIAVSRAPHSLAVSPDGRTVLVAGYEADAVDLIDAATLRRTGPFPVGHSPQSVGFATDGAHAFVVNEGDDSVSVLDPRTGATTASVEVGRSPRTIAVAPDGRVAYVTNGVDDTLTVLRVGA